MKEENQSRISLEKRRIRGKTGSVGLPCHRHQGFSAKSRPSFRLLSRNSQITERQHPCTLQTLRSDGPNEGLQYDLPGKYHELAYYKSSQLNSCDYCLHAHKQAAEQAGVTSQQLSDIADFESGGSFDEKEKSILRYAKELTKSSNVQHATVEAVKEFLDETQLVTLAATVALANFTNRSNHGLGVHLP